MYIDELRAKHLHPRQLTKHTLVFVYYIGAESLHAHHHRASQASVEDVDDREEGEDVEDGAIVGQEGHQVM